MTAQAPEILHYQGQELSMCTEPLGDYFELAGLKPSFQVWMTALWRGYVGMWEISQERLYLVGLSGTLADGTRASLETFFPGFGERVFAHWFCGTIRAPQGRLLNYEHAGYASTYERDLFIKVDRGLVQETSVRHNGAADNVEAEPGYVIGGTYVFPKRAKAPE